jgi:hypothetical protein
MKRIVPLCCLALLGGLLILARATSQDTPKDPPPAKAEPPADRLQQSIKFPGFNNPNTPLQEALDVLSELGKIDIDVDEDAFKVEGLNDVLKSSVAEKPIRKSERIRLDRALRRVLDRIPVPSGATYLLRKDGIEVTTNQALRTRVWGPAYGGPHLPLVHATIDKKPLNEALKELSDQAEYNIVIDKRAGDSITTPVTARFVNTPLDTAVSLLADMADLAIHQQDNVIYVTSPDGAAALDFKRKGDPLIMDDPNATPRGVGPGVGSRVPVTPPGAM